MDWIEESRVGNSQFKAVLEHVDLGDTIQPLTATVSKEHVGWEVFFHPLGEMLSALAPPPPVAPLAAMAPEFI